MLIDFRNIRSIEQSKEIELPLSKSESNRALMILHYAKSRSDSKIPSLSNSDDTILLQNLLNKINNQSLSSADACPSIIELDCGNAFWWDMQALARALWASVWHAALAFVLSIPTSGLS